jgi:hypothetical protein
VEDETGVAELRMLHAAAGGARQHPGAVFVEQDDEKADDAPEVPELQKTELASATDGQGEMHGKSRSTQACHWISNRGGCPSPKM